MLTWEGGPELHMVSALGAGLAFPSLCSASSSLLIFPSLQDVFWSLSPYSTAHTLHRDTWLLKHSSPPLAASLSVLLTVLPSFPEGGWHCEPGLQEDAYKGTGH